MPQEFRVVQCCNCKAFQVDIIKKVPKWSCKLCGEKQSVRKIFLNGSAKECRLAVQDLNEKRIRFEAEELPRECNLEYTVQEQLQPKEDGSKWLEFLQDSENNVVSDEIENSCMSKSKSNETILVLEKREMETDNLSCCNKFKPDSNIKKIGVNVCSENIFDSKDNYDIDSLLDI